MQWQMVGRSTWMFPFVSLALVLADGREVSAEEDFTQFIPNGTLNDSNTKGDGCGHCHVLTGGNGRNAFGARWNRIGWGPLLAGEDSDDDGVTNGWELGEPLGTWSNGQPDPGDPALVTSPGQDGSVPPILSVSPLQIDHSVIQGDNLVESFTVENIGGDCFGNPIGACTLSIDVTTAEDWMAFDPATARWRLSRRRRWTSSFPPTRSWANWKEARA
jgi:hypothetical protein